MTLQDIEKRMEEIDANRQTLKQEAQALKVIRTELLDAQEFDEKLATMKPEKRAKFLQRVSANSADVNLN